jgi:hypothetical protein
VATTTNFGWTTPDNTGYVKDGALAIRTLGSAIDTSMVDFKGGTTGQVLAKASNTDMDFIWATDAANGYTTIATGTLSGSSVTVSSIPGTYVNLQLDVYNMTSSSNSGFLVTVNGLSSNYAQSLYYHANGSSGNSGQGSGGDWSFAPASTFDRTSDANHLQMTFYNYAATNRVALASSTINYLYGDGTTKFTANGSHANTGINAAITSVTVASQVGTFSGGTYILRGVK